MENSVTKKIPENIDQIIIQMIKKMRPDLGSFTESSDLQSSGLHEVDLIELIIDLEEEYDIDIEDSRVVEAESIADIKSYLQTF